MPKPVPIPVRRKLFQRAQRGESLAGLAAAFGLAPRTVRHLVRRFRDRGPDAPCGLPRRPVRHLAGRFRARGPDAIPPDYPPPRDLPHAYPGRAGRAALARRREPPAWGAALIWVALGEREPGLARPSPS